jgi:hydrogenase maturation protease
MNILVLGIGQSFRGDDAAGLEAVHLWQAQHPESTTRVNVEFSELPGLELLDWLVGMDVAILVDAIRWSANAGTVIRLGSDELASFTPDIASSHGWGVAETLHLGFSLYPYLVKCRIILFGIVGKDFRLGAGFSPEVQAAMLKVVGMVECEIRCNIL